MPTTTPPAPPPVPPAHQQRLAVMAASMSEADLLYRVRRLATGLGWLSYHTWRSDRSDPGFPDLVLVRGTRFLARELKTARGRLTPAQTEWLDRMTFAGVDAGVWRPVDLLDKTIERTLLPPTPAAGR